MTQEKKVKDKTRELVIAKGKAPNGEATVTIYEREYNELKIIQGNSGVDYQSINEAFDLINSNISALQSMIFNTKRSMLLAIQGYSITREGAIIPMTPVEQPMTQEEANAAAAAAKPTEAVAQPVETPPSPPTTPTAAEKSQGGNTSAPSPAQAKV